MVLLALCFTKRLPENNETISGKPYDFEGKPTFSSLVEYVERDYYLSIDRFNVFVRGRYMFNVPKVLSATCRLLDRDTLHVVNVFLRHTTLILPYRSFYE